ncbi:hypothetical protein [Achromobacter aloeverae]
MANKAICFPAAAMTFISASLLVFASLTVTVRAGTTASPGERSAPVTVGDIDAIMQDEILLRALNSRAEQRAKLNQYETPPAELSSSSSLVPRLAWRRRTTAGWVAKFVYANGSATIAGVRDSLPGGFQVTKVGPDEVRIKRGSEDINLSAALPESDMLAVPSSASSPDARVPQ